MEVYKFETDIKLTNYQKKYLNEIINSYKKKDDMNKKQCLLCKKEVNSYKNSHSIPQSVISKIAVDGKILNMSAILNSDFSKRESGIAEAQTFKYICDECENRFSTYENGNLWEKLNDKKTIDRALLEIKIKNILHKLYIRKENFIEYNGMEEYAKQFNDDTYFFQAKMEKEIKSIDWIDWHNELNKYRHYIIGDKDCKGLFKVLYLKKLNYVVPIALQEDEYYIHDIMWDVINDVYDYKQSHRIKGLSVCVFPQKESTIILMFVEDGCRTYNNLIKQLICLPIEEQLKWLTFLIFTYTEGYCISKKLDITNLQGIKRITTLDDHIRMNPYESGRKIDIQIEERRKIFEQGFENILLEKYRID